MSKMLLIKENEKAGETGLSTKFKFLIEVRKLASCKHKSFVSF